MRRAGWGSAAVGLVLAAAPAGAVDTSRWEVRGAAALASAETEKVAITADGAAVLAPSRVPAFAESGESYVWSLAAAPDGVVYAGTGDGGLVVKVPREGEASQLYDSIELEILALVVGPDGAVYAGGSPDGVVIRIQDGKAETFFDSPESYVWALAFGPDGNLYAATGDRGRLYRITPDGEGTIYYDSDEVHLLCLLPAPNGHWIAGTSNSGLVLEVTGKDEARVLYDAPEEEVKALTRDEAGNLVFAVVGGGGRDGSAKDGGGEAKAAVPGEIKGIEVRAERPDAGGDRERSGKGRAVVYRQTPTGATARLWRSPESLVLALEPDGQGGLLVGTGDKGAIYRLDARGTATRLVEMSESQVLVLRRTAGGVLVGTANPGNIYRFGPSVEPKGTVTAKPYDAGNAAAWGQLRFEGERPPSTAIEIRTRTGNTEKPDATWSAWSEPLTDPEGTAITSPPARFIQWQATLAGSRNLSPRLIAVVVPYRQENLPPHIQAVDVNPPSDRLLPLSRDGAPDRVVVTLPNGLQAEFSRPAVPPTALRRDQVPWLRDVKVANWVAEDPNDDRLEFDLYVRGENESQWSPLAEEVAQQTHAFPTAGLPDGTYRLKVVASDRSSNPEAGALADSLDSAPFLVDNTPPRVTALRVQRESGDRLLVNATVADELSPIRALEYSLDSRAWKSTFPVDGIYDEREERFEFAIDLARAEEQGFKLPRAGAGDRAKKGESAGLGAELTVLVRAADAAGNEGAARAVAP
jgi:WD40 repeat protein